MSKGSVKLSGKSLLDGNAAAGDVIEGKKVYVQDVRNAVIGTLKLGGTAAEQDVLAPATFFDPITRTIKKGLLTLAGMISATTTAPAQVLSGYKFYDKNGVFQSGTMPDHGAWGTTLAPGGSVTIPAGYHGGSGIVAASSSITKSATNIIGGFYRSNGIESQPTCQSINVGWGSFNPKTMNVSYWFYSQDEESGTINFPTNVYGIKSNGSEVLIDSFTVGFNEGNGSGNQTRTFTTSEYFVGIKVMRATGWKHRAGSGYNFTITSGIIKA